MRYFYPILQNPPALAKLRFFRTGNLLNPRYTEKLSRFGHAIGQMPSRRVSNCADYSSLRKIEVGGIVGEDFRREESMAAVR